MNKKLYMAGFGKTNKFNKRPLTHLKKKYDENEILNRAINFHHKGNISEANKLYKFLIELAPYNKPSASMICKVCIIETS